LLLMFRLIAKWKRTWLRRIVVVLAVFVILLGQIGMPVPARVIKDKSRPFPCMHRACGCHKADDCLKKCCCFSKSERVAWAKRHHVEMPKDAEDSPKTAICRSASEINSLCGSPESIRELTKRQDCCEKVHTQTPACKIASKQPSQYQDKKEDGYLAWQQFRECRGAPNVWTAGVDSLPPPTSVEFVIAQMSQLYSLAIPDLMVSIDLDPPVPPPKIA